MSSPDLDQIQRYWDAVRTPGEIVELRYPTSYTDKKTGKLKAGSRNVRCGGPEELASAIEKIGPELTYWVNLQQMKQDTAPKPHGGALADSDIECYRWLPVEVDPRRPKKVSATAPEKEHARVTAFELYEYFKELGVSPAVIDSGNGFYVLPPIDLPNASTNRALVERAIAGLKAKFYRKSPEGLVAEVDGTASNPSRVLGLPGTVNAKGTSTPDRPHRPRLLLCAGSRDVLLSVRQLEEMASWAAVSKSRSSPSAYEGRGPFTFENVEELLGRLRDRTAAEVEADKRASHFDFEEGRPSGGEGWNVRCPNDAEHTNPADDLNGSTVVWMTNRGFPIFKCSHNGASGKPCYEMGWSEFIEGWHAGDLQRDIVDPELPRSFTWPEPQKYDTPRIGPIWIFATETEFAVFKHRVEQTPAWAHAAEWKDPDGWPELPADYEEWRAAQPSVEKGFKFPRIAGRVREYTMLPRGRFDGWFGRGRVSIVGGSSGAGKTSLMCDLLYRQWLGSSVLGHAGAGLRPLVIFADRGELSNAETLDRLGLDSKLPIAHLPVCWDATATKSILELVEKQNPLPEVVFVEGADALVSDAMKTQVVAPFLSGLQEIAAHYHIAIVLSVGAPKSKPREQHTLRRDRIFGSQMWPRMADTISTLEAVGDGTGARRNLSVQHRNAPSESFDLEFQGGRLVEHVALTNLDALDIWLSKRDPKSWFTRNQVLEAMTNGETGMRKTTVYDRLKEMLECGILERRWNTEKKKEELRQRVQDAGPEAFAGSEIGGVVNQHRPIA